MRVLLSGGTGFVGLRLLTRLSGARVLSRDPARARALLDGGAEVLAWNPAAGPPDAAAFADVDAVIHLAGETIGQRWTRARKEQVRQSRIQGTRHLVEGLRRASSRPAVLLCASAIGYYGDCGDRELDEQSPPGNDFLAQLCRDWEAEAHTAASLGMRVIHARLGIVLELGGGALARMLPLFRLGLAGRLGSGRQWMSWVHLDDAVDVLLHAAGKQDVQGALNVVAPTPVTNAAFTRTLGLALGRPTVLPAPAALLRLALGEMAQMLLGSQRVLPRVAQRSGYAYKYPDLPSALRHILAPTGE